MRSDRDLLEKSGVRWRSGVTISRARSTSARVTEIGVLHGGPARDRTWDQQIMSPPHWVRTNPTRSGTSQVGEGLRGFGPERTHSYRNNPTYMATRWPLSATQISSARRAC